jgi:hypothetical protein
MVRVCLDPARVLQAALFACDVFLEKTGLK